MATNRKQADADAERVALEYLAGIRSLEPETSEDVSLMRRRPDGRVDTFRRRGGVTSSDMGGVSEDVARQMHSSGGYRMVPDDEFERAKHGGPVRAPQGTTPFIRDVSRHAAPKDYDATLPVDPGRTLAAAASLGRGFKGSTETEAPKAAPKKGQGKGQPSISVGMPAAAREGAGRLPGPSTLPTGAQKALAASTEAPADAARAVDPYGDARASANRNRLGVQLARAGGMVNEAMSGARLDRAAYDDLETQAEEPVADFMARRAMGREDAAAASALEERRLRAEDYARRWAAGDRDFKYRQGRDTAEDTLARDRMAADERRWKAELGARSADRHEARQARLDARTAAEEERNERARLAREAKEQQASDKALQTLGQQTSKLPIGELQQALESIETQAPGMAYGRAPEDNPLSLKDRVARRIPYGAGEWAMSAEGKRYAANIAQLRDITMRMRSGAAINESEMRHYLSLLGDDILSDPQKAAEGINTVRKGLAQRMRNIQAPYVRGGTLDEYERQGGSSFRAPIFNGEAPPAVAKPTGRTVTRRDGSVWEELSDGSARRAR